MKCNTEGCNQVIFEGDDYCEGCEWNQFEEHLDFLSAITDTNSLDENTCRDCGDYAKDGGWCEQCLDVDLEEHEERKRTRLAEAQEY